MRIILQYYHGFLQKKTERIDIDPEETTNKLIERISQKVGRASKDLVIKFKRDGATVRVMKDFPISHYDIQAGQKILVEIHETETEKQRNESQRLQHRFLGRLGIGQIQKLSGISEGSEEEKSDDDDQNQNITQKKSDGIMNPFERQLSYSSSNDDTISEKSQIERYAIIQKKYLDNLKNELFKQVKKGDVNEIKLLLKNTADIPEELKKEEILKVKEQFLIDATQGGWNTLHFAVFQDYLKLVEYLLTNGADVNKITEDGWTPLQIAIHKNNFEIFKLLMKEQQLQVNLKSERGLAISIACKSSRIPMIQILLQSKADPNLKDNKDNNAMDYCNTQEALNLIQPYMIYDQQQDLNEPYSVIDVQQMQSFKPPRPPIIRGYIQKTGGLILNLQERYFVLNPDQGTLIRYLNEQNYPLKPIEIIPLKSLRRVEMCQKQWYMKSNLFYFEVFYTSRMILACKHENTAKAWVHFIYQAAVYSVYVDDMYGKGDLEIEQPFQNEPVQNIILSDEDDKLPIQMNLDQIKQEEEIKQNTIVNNEQKQTDQTILNNKPIEESKQESQQIMQQQQQQQKSVSSTPLKSSEQSTEKSDQSTSQNGAEKKKLENEQEKIDSAADLQELVKDTKVVFSSFEVIKQLGSGAFGKVFLVRKRDDQEIYAMKALKKRNLIIKKQLKYAVTEANVLKQCRHPFILGLHYAFQTPNYLYLVLDFCPGGDLSYHLAQLTRLSEEQTRFYIAELILAIEYLHQQNVIYRDLKPENILLDQFGHIKLADFGLSKENVNDSDKTKSFCGSPAYLSPEMLSQKGAGKSSDIYGIGAVMYEMIVGEPPYYSDDIPTMYKNIREGILKFPSHISDDCKNCIKGLLERDPVKRLGTKSKQEIKDCQFFSKIDWKRVYNREYKPPITDFSDLQDEEEDEIDSTMKGGKNVFNDNDYDEQNVRVNRVIKFSFSKEI